MCVPLDINSINLAQNVHEYITDCFIIFESIRHTQETKVGMLMEWAEIIFFVFVCLKEKAFDYVNLPSCGQ